MKKREKLTDDQRELLELRIRVNMEDTESFAQKEKKRLSFSPEKRRVILCGVFMVLFFLLSVLLTCNVFNGNFSLAWVVKHSFRRVEDIVDLLTGNHLQSGIQFWLCQFASTMIAGMALAVSGACFQALFHNPMASPTMLGVESGGTLGSVIFLMFFYTPMLSGFLQVSSYESYAMEYNAMSFWQKYGQCIAVFIGCIIVVVIVMILTKVVGRGKLSTVPLMIGGTIFTSSISTIITVVTYYEATIGGDSTIIMELQALQSGSFTGISTPVLLLCFAIPALVPLFIIFPLCGRLNILAFGEDEAKLLGVTTGRERFLFILLSTILTAAVVAFCGAISFVGLIIPHIARYFVGSDFRRLVPASAFLGGIFMLLAFDVSYMINFFVEAGTIINVVGGTVFMVYMAKHRRGGRGYMG